MTADSVGGVWTYALDLAEGLAAGGVQTTLALLGPGPQRDQLVAAAAVPGLKLLQTGLPLDADIADRQALKLAAQTLTSLAHRARADVVHLNSPALAADAGFRAPVVGGCHWCLASWWARVHGGELPEPLRWRTVALARGYQACDVLLAPTAAFGCVTAELYGVEPPRVVRHGRRHDGRARPAPRERFVMTTGRLWDPAKNIDTLEAAAALRGLPLFAAGPLDGPHGEHVRLRQAEALGRVDSAAIGGWLDRAQVFASLARYEPFGLTVLEAAQAGCALVLSDIPTFRELWDGAAAFTPADDAEAASDLLQALLDDPGRSARLGEAARKRARRYSPEAMSLGALKVYRSLLQDRAARAA